MALGRWSFVPFQSDDLFISWLHCVYVVVWWRTSLPSCDDHIHRHSPVPKCKANNYCEIKPQHITFGLPGLTWRTKSPATNCSLLRRSMHCMAPGRGYHCWCLKRIWWLFVWCTFDDLKRIGRMHSLTHIKKLWTDRNNSLNCEQTEITAWTGQPLFLCGWRADSDGFRHMKKAALTGSNG